MIVNIDQNLCTSCGICGDICSSCFTCNDDEIEVDANW